MTIVALRGVPSVGITRSLAHTLSALMAESKRILKVLPVAVKDCGLGVTLGTFARSPLARTWHMAPATHPPTRAQKVRGCHVKKRGELEIFGREHRPSLPIVVVC